MTGFISLALIVVFVLSAALSPAAATVSAEELTESAEAVNVPLLTEPVEEESVASEPETAPVTEPETTAAEPDTIFYEPEEEALIIYEEDPEPETAESVQEAADEYFLSIPLEETSSEEDLQQTISLQAADTISVKTGYVNVSGLNVRKGPGTTYASIGSVSYTTVVILGTEKDASKNIWYKISYGFTEGYICGSYGYVTNVKTSRVSTANSGIEAFPEEYQDLLLGILAVYPKFRFVPENLDCTLEYAADWHTGRKVESDGGWWKTSSNATVLEYMNPLTYLTIDKIFGFAEQYYNSSQNKAGLKKMLTRLNCFLNTDSYISALIKAGKKYDVNPYVLAATISIEKGSDAVNAGNPDVTGRPVFQATVKSDGVNVRSGPGTGYSSRGKVNKGTIYIVGASQTKASYKKDSNGKKWYQVVYNGYPGYIIQTYLKNITYYDSYYNLFSINQSDDNVVVGSISYAMDKGWNTPEKSLIGGAKFYKNGYINNGQDTYYYKDFNVANDQSNWWHEYAGAVNSVAASALLLSYAYTGDANAELTFRIPVYQQNGLSAPRLLSTKSTATGNKITWEGNPLTTKYRVYRKEPGGKWTKLKDVKKTAYNDTTAKAGKRYLYTVKAFVGTAAGKYDKAGLSCVYVPQTAFSSLKNKSAYVLLKWKPVNVASGYRLYRRVKGTGKWTVLAKSLTVNSYKDTTAKNGTKYEYLVRPYCVLAGSSWFASANAANVADIKK